MSLVARSAVEEDARTDDGDYAVAERCDNVRSLMVWRILFAPDVNDPGAYCSYCCAASRASTRLVALLCLPGRGDVSSFTCVYAVGEIILRIRKLLAG